MSRKLSIATMRPRRGRALQPLVSKNESMEQLPKIVRERLRAGAVAGVHPDADLLTAFAENSLAQRERLPVLEHLATCVDCREVVTLAQPELVLGHVAAAAMAATPAVAATPPPNRPRWSTRLVFGWATAAACVVMGAALLRYQVREKAPVQMASRDAAPVMNTQPQANAAPPREESSKQRSATKLEDELTAKLEAPASPRGMAATRAESARVDKDSNRAASERMLDQAMDKKSGAAMGGMAPAAPPIPQSSEQVTVSGEAGKAAAAPAPADLPLQARPPAAKTDTPSLTASAAAPPAEKENKPATSNTSIGAFAGSGGGIGSGSSLSRQKLSPELAKATASNRGLARVSSNYMATRWSISSDGSTLLRSLDEGASWSPVGVAANVVFRAVAAVGPEVWAGGKDGALYHSADMGAHWDRVQPAANGVRLTGDVVSLDFSDILHGKLTTSEGKVWTTADGGKSWQTQ